MTTPDASVCALLNKCSLVIAALIVSCDVSHWPITAVFLLCRALCVFQQGEEMWRKRVQGGEWTRQDNPANVFSCSTALRSAVGACSVCYRCCYALVVVVVVVVVTSVRFLNLFAVYAQQLTNVNLINNLRGQRANSIKYYLFDSYSAHYNC